MDEELAVPLLSLSGLLWQALQYWRGLGDAWPTGGGRRRVFLELGGVGRVVVELDPSAAPVLAENFLRLCVGERRDAFGRRLTYRSSRLHAVLASGLVLGGDVVHGNGGGGVSAMDAAAHRRHPADPRVLDLSEAGMVAAGGLWDGDERAFANSVFAITTKALCPGRDVFPELVPFGRVVEGLPLLQRLTPDLRPAIIILDCGLLP